MQKHDRCGTRCSPIINSAATQAVCQRSVSGDFGARVAGDLERHCFSKSYKSKIFPGN